MFGGACTLVNVYLCRLSEVCVSLSVARDVFDIGSKGRPEFTRFASSRANPSHLVALGYLQDLV